MRALTMVSIVLGVLSILVCFTYIGGFLFAVPGVVLAHVVRWKTPVADRGKHLTTAFVLGYGGLGLAILGFVYLAFIADWR